MGNGVTERFNRTLGNMLRTLPPTMKARWPRVLQTLTFCYNCTVHETTGFAPFYLMFGRVPRLPIDIVFQHGLQDERVVSHNEFVSQLRQDLCEAARIAQNHSFKEQARHARLYNHKVKGSPLAVGDRVLLANRGERGKRKLADKWISTPYDVVSVRAGINVYRIRDAQSGKERVVHRNLLLPVDFLFMDKVETPASFVNSDNGDEECGSGQVSVHVDNEDGYDRTVDWLMNSPDPVPASDVHLSDPVTASDAHLPDPVPASDVHLSDPVPASDAHLPDPVPASDAHSPDPVPASDAHSSDSDPDSVTLPTDPDPDSVTLPPDPDPVSAADLTDPDSVGVSRLTFTEVVDETNAICTQPHSVHAGCGGSVTTRCGRHVKPPKKLIYEMAAQKVEDTSSVTSSVY
ncbi:uncharacterized protein LOC117545187 [Gymnodraco acuticeps]|uniref:Uncharacterized protein LOC117545187 n=1 Tax=Gymnodraco acuticeps TaxID=8218 RepID=A0A6P8UZV0_GYMAC|nr:uncharacterized protein LOC117545187 [Gymnodraco acuticeps]